MINNNNFRSSTMPNLEGFKEYFDAVAFRCPFAQPAKNKGYARFTSYDFEKWDLKDITLLVFLHIEILRKEYSELKKLNKSNAYLLNENLIFGDSNTPQLKDIFIQIHWFFTLLYTKKGWVFGKFYKFSYPKDRTNIIISDYQLNLVSLRPIMPQFDGRFYEKIYGLQGDLATYTDDGKSLFPLQNNIIDIDNLTCKEDITEKVKKLKEAGFYQILTEKVTEIELENNLCFDTRYN